jgi:hypothetical protein
MSAADRLGNVHSPGIAPLDLSARRRRIPQKGLDGKLGRGAARQQPTTCVTHQSVLIEQLQAILLMVSDPD